MFLKYSRNHVHFYEHEIPLLLEVGIRLILTNVRRPNIIDLGCGDGRTLFALYKRGLLRNVGDIVGVDISYERIKRLKSNLPFVKGLVADACNVKEFPDQSFDFVICSQVIEHVEDDRALLREIKRLLRKGGLLYLSSVVRN